MFAGIRCYQSYRISPELHNDEGYLIAVSTGTYLVC